MRVVGEARGERLRQVGGFKDHAVRQGIALMLLVRAGEARAPW
jgi:hypothetical protein